MVPGLGRSTSRIEEAVWRLHSVLGPATWLELRKQRGLPPCTIAEIASFAKSRDEIQQETFLKTDERSHELKQRDSVDIIRRGFGGVHRTRPNYSRDREKRLRLARRATRQPPLGEPPLVLTTHSITSFTLRHPGLAGVQPRARAGSSRTHHVACVPSRSAGIIRSTPSL